MTFPMDPADGPAPSRPATPAQAWDELARGNRRFVTGTRAHPNQDVEHRTTLVEGQRPFAVCFGCADSRVAAEMVFDQGLGDLFVVRTAGHVVDDAVLGSIEFAVAVLQIPLIVVLGHDSCGAVGAAVASVDGRLRPQGYLRDLVERITPSVLAARRAGLTQDDQVESEHIRATIQLLRDRSRVVAQAVDEARLGIVGAQYALSDGQVSPVVSVGAVPA